MGHELIMVDTIFFTFVFAWYSVLRNLLERVLIILLLKLLSCATSWTIYSPWNFPGQNIGVGSLSLLQGIFPTQGLNPGLLHCRWILYQLRYQGSPEITLISFNLRNSWEIHLIWLQFHILEFFPTKKAMIITVSTHP